MSNLSSWSSLSVGKFFQISNWQGKPLKNSSGTSTFLATSQQEVKRIVFSNPSWSAISVQQFFAASNWEGKKIAINIPLTSATVTNAAESGNLAPALLDSWSFLTVQKFFNVANWEGKENLPAPVIQPSYSEKSLNFNLTVSDFFSEIHWQGKPQIGILPKEDNSNFELPPELEPTISALSDLF